jgi:hypothetical protein
MDIVLKVILAVLVFLAVSSGVTKIMLTPQDVEFFGAYGFSDPILIAYGAAQVVGGVMLIIRRTRFTGAVIVAITFAISAIVLVVAGKIMVAIVTVVAILMLGTISRLGLEKGRKPL